MQQKRITQSHEPRMVCAENYVSSHIVLNRDILGYTISCFAGLKSTQLTFQSA